MRSLTDSECFELSAFFNFSDILFISFDFISIKAFLVIIKFNALNTFSTNFPDFDCTSSWFLLMNSFSFFHNY